MCPRSEASGGRSLSVSCECLGSERPHSLLATSNPDAFEEIDALRCSRYQTEN